MTWDERGVYPWSKVMSQGKGYTIGEAAEIIGVSSRQVRRYIKQGKLDATLVEGKFGEEYRIPAIPAEMTAGKPARAGGAVSGDDVQGDASQPIDIHDINEAKPPDTGGETESEPIDITSNKMALEIIRRLEEENRNLAGQLGMAQARVKQLEGEVRLLEAGRKRSWWKRLLGR